MNGDQLMALIIQWVDPNVLDNTEGEILAALRSGPKTKRQLLGLRGGPSTELKWALIKLCPERIEKVKLGRNPVYQLKKGETE